MQRRGFYLRMCGDQWDKWRAGRGMGGAAGGMSGDRRLSKRSPTLGLSSRVCVDSLGAGGGGGGGGGVTLSSVGGGGVVPV